MKAVVLARGLGTRMRAADPDVRLSDVQRAAADAGLKPMIPVNGRPFLDYALGALADAGIGEVALIVAPEHDEIRRHYASLPPTRIDLSFVVQPDPLGTADAVLAAAAWTRGEPFLAMNADNLYPVAALVQLAALDEPGLLAFDRDDLVRSGNIRADRVRSFAVLDVDADGYLARIVEKPASLDEILVSMNCWRFDSRIFDACRRVPRSARGELELPEAVALATVRGIRFKALRADGPVLDLSRRADAVDVERRLANVEPRP
jgi:dTDP-glucose pyrophosphorylase